jgi:hypothetical protein
VCIQKAGKEIEDHVPFDVSTLKKLKILFYGQENRLA